MAAVHISSLIEETGSDRIDELIPHKYLRGEDHGKRDGGGSLFDLRVDAGGMEPQLEELQHRFHLYQTGRYEALLDRFDQEAAGSVYLIDKSKKHDPHVDFVFSDKTALQNVRFRHFMADCRAIAGNVSELDPVSEEEKSATLSFLDEAHLDILKNFDPKIVKLRKKRKIIVADGAFDSLYEMPED